LLSAKTETALERTTENLSRHLKEHPELNLADVAFTLQVGRRSFEHRRMLVCRDVKDAVHALESRDEKRVLTAAVRAAHRPVVFMFPGQGAQYLNMGLGLYTSSNRIWASTSAGCSTRPRTTRRRPRSRSTRPS
jgi:acyl transferase domain-containing protein